MDKDLDRKKVLEWIERHCVFIDGRWFTNTEHLVKAITNGDFDKED